ncbi:MAG: type IIL restriction-modification enzyme MmeI [Pseudomonadota bacterium]
MPKVSNQRRENLEEHWWEIDLARKEAGFGRTLAELYTPKKMPEDLRTAHEDLDRTVEAIFGARKYRSDADRIEHMLNEYDKLIAAEAA